ncbi:hypothetical protein A200_01160 [Parascardovia denticolens IPLA 20019]|nr:hypothetical protein A200_01160 [Parascardovia denticolens IPLA 20019]
MRETIKIKAKGIRDRPWAVKMNKKIHTKVFDEEYREEMASKPPANPSSNKCFTLYFCNTAFVQRQMRTMP